MAESKLNWTVKKDKDGKFIRRSIDGDSLHLTHIDVEWTHEDGFPKDTEIVPVSHPPNVKYEERPCGTRDVIKDQVSVTQDVKDSTIAKMLDEKAETLAKALGIEK